MYIHPNYTQTAENVADMITDFDIALIELESELPDWSKTLKPACLDIDRHTEREQLVAWSGMLMVSFKRPN